MEIFLEIGGFFRECSALLGAGFVYLRDLKIENIAAVTENLRQLSIESVILRLVLAMALGGLIGLERGRKNRPAGFRTYMVVCLGATLTMILGQYEYQLMETVWAEQTAALGAKTDISRFGAQVINGIGFLGAGTILVTGKQQIKGLTTAASLWASACMGLALGAGFYECVFLAFGMILLVVLILPRIEMFLIEKARNMNLYVELTSLEGISDIIGCLKGMNIQIYDVDIERGKQSQAKRPNAVFSIRLCKKQSHTQVVAALSRLEGICVIEEI